METPVEAKACSNEKSHIQYVRRARQHACHYYKMIFQWKVHSKTPVIIPAAAIAKIERDDPHGSETLRESSLKPRYPVPQPIAAKRQRYVPVSCTRSDSKMVHFFFAVVPFLSLTSPCADMSKLRESWKPQVSTLRIKTKTEDWRTRVTRVCSGGRGGGVR